MEPAVPDRRGGLFGPVEIRPQGRIPAGRAAPHRELAHLARRHVASGIVDQPHLDAGNRPSHRRRVGELFCVAEVGDERLGRAEHRVDLGVRQQGEKLLLQRHGERLGRNDDPAERSAARRVFPQLGEQQADHRRHQPRDRDALPLDRGQGLHGIELREDHQRPAQAERVEQPRDAGAVRERSDDEVAVVSADAPFVPCMSTFCTIMFACVSTAPFGVPVVPDVYMIRQSSSSSGSRGSGTAGVASTASNAVSPGAASPTDDGPASGCTPPAGPRAFAPALVVDRRRGRGVSEHVRHLIRGEPCVHRNCESTECEHRVDSLHELDAVREARSPPGRPNVRRAARAHWPHTPHRRCSSA